MTSLAVMGLLPRRAQRTTTRLTFDGQDLERLSGRRMAALRGNRMAMIFQEPMTSLNPAYSIGDQLMEELLCHRRVGRREARERAIHLLARVGIPAPDRRLATYPNQLSGGLAREGGVK